MIARFFLVCLGGALGSGARYATSLWAASTFDVAFPFGTLIVNVAGSFLIGAVMELLPPSELRLVLTVGVLGGFTTYSSFNEETLRLLRGGMMGGALLNLGATVAGCLIAGVAGLAVARLIR
jgi:CrcB protein